MSLAELLVDLGGRLMGAQTARQAASHAVLTADRLVGWDAAFVSLYEPELKASTILFMADEIVGERTELSAEYGHQRPASPLFLRALETGPFIIDRAEVARWNKPFSSFGDTTRQTQSLLYAPIRDREGRNIGLISLQSYTNDHFKPEHIPPVRLLADLVAHSLLRFSLEDSLSQRQTGLDLLLAEMPAILWTTDTNLVFTSATGAALERVGLSPAQMIGITVDEFGQTVGNPNYRAYHERALSGEQVTYDCSFLGRSFHVRLRPLRDREGLVIGAVGLATDGTELLKAEEARRELEIRMLQTQKLESLGVLAGGISHEFNNLLVGVLGNSGLALEDLPPGHAAREPVEMIEQTAIRMRELTRQLLAYSGRGRFMSRSLEIGKLIRESQELISTCVSKKADLTVILDESPLPIRGDQMQLRQLLLNLASNASDSLEDGPGKVTITTCRRLLKPSELPSLVELPQSTEREFALIEVEDTGCGIREEVIARIFDPFFTTKTHGRGLGMAAVQGIVRSHGGGLQINSTPGLGTTVRVFLPIDESEVTQPGRIITKPGVSRLQGTVLIAEDEPVVRSFLTDVLGREGLTVLQAENGEIALRMFQDRKSEIRMVILDVVMPKLGGPDAYIHMRNDQPTLPALFISGASDQDLTRKGLNVTKRNFLAKPFSRDALIEKVRAFF